MAAALGPDLSAQAAPPAKPRVVEMLNGPGKRGGDLRTLVGSAKDLKYLMVYGYARLVAYDRAFELVPDILESYEVEEGRRFTFHLREGHKWSDGTPFTTEDFRFFWEDVANHEKLRPTGPPIEMAIDGKYPDVEVVDELTIRYTWEKPNPFFLAALADAAPLLIYMPSQYLKLFHEDHADPQELAAKVEAESARDWAQLFGRKSRAYKISNAELPTLQPWDLVTAPPAERFVAERNPYFHRVDQNGVQLPYIDRVIMSVVDSKLIPVKTGAGETDLQSRGLHFKDVTFLKESEQRSGLDTHLWEPGRAAHLALFPNLNASDDSWRELFRDVRFRRALSLGIDRQSINQFLYFGLARAANNTVLPSSPLYTEAVGTAYTQHDPEKANALLDEIGLTQKNGEGIRLMADGRPVEFVVETAGEETEESDVLELISDQWREIGVKIHTKPSQLETLRDRIFSGATLMTISYGHDNGIPSAEMSPENYAPTNQVQYQWPKWGQYYETRGQAGEAPDMEHAVQLFELFDKWRVADSRDERQKIWDEMLQIYADQVYTIGTVSGILQPIAAHEALRNLPNEAMYNWNPGAFFGVHLMDSFWIEP
ncbi:MAG: ABC transporter substrate-binding protein [Geminicoccaceae bacterium]